MTLIASDTIIVFVYLFTADDVCVQKELGDRKSASIDFVRQLLPLPKMFCEVIISEYVHSGSGDSRSGGSTHKASSDADQRKQVSLQISSCSFLASSVHYI